MKIGIITFHWATNYGAVLQAYALQKYLAKEGYNVQIIDYVPKSVRTKQKLIALKNRDFAFFLQEKLLYEFRKQYLNLTEKKYSSHKSLIKGKFDFDTIIAGSDQIWNESFTLRGEGKVTLSYFADFAADNVKRIAYAASFGFHTPTEQYIETVKQEMRKFYAISVRETDGVDIVAAHDLKCCVVCDPTALLTKQDYKEIIKNNRIEGCKVFAYILRENQEEAWKTAKYVGAVYGEDIVEKKYIGSMEDWLSSVLQSSIVVTNSFHGVMLSIIMNKPFIALLINGSGMNSRITTLLEKTGLTSRLAEHFSEENINKIVAADIDWKEVNQNMSELRLTGINFLRQVLRE